MINTFREVIHAIVRVSKGHIGYGLEEEIRAKSIEALRLLNLRVAITIPDLSKNIAILTDNGFRYRIKYIEE